MRSPSSPLFWFVRVSSAAICLITLISLWSCGQKSIPDTSPYVEARVKRGELPPETDIAVLKDQHLTAQTKIADVRRWYSHEPWVARTTGLPRVGLALSGGGSKSAPFAMGLLKRLAEKGWLEQVDLISSVSGGGYAAYYYYAKMIWLMEQGQAARDTLAPYGRTADDDRAFFFAPFSYDARDREGFVVWGRSPDCANGPEPCPPDKTPYDCLTFSDNSARFQNWVACYQNVLTPQNSEGYLTPTRKPWEIYVYGLLSTLAMLPAHHIANTVFDWDMELAPTQHMYRDGLERTYGYTPHPGKNRSLDFRDDENVTRLDFAQLRDAQKHFGAKMPMWIISATNGVSTTWLDVSKSKPLHDTVFEITPYGFGSETFQYMRTGPEALGLTIPRSVLASAAFLDPLQQTYTYRTWIYIGLHTFNLRWGISVPNYLQGDEVRGIHAMLPFPFYTLYHSQLGPKAPNIRLSDGGQSGDNLGLFSLLRRGTRNIIVADGAQDRFADGVHMDDLCVVNDFLKGEGYEMVFDGNPEGGKGPFHIEAFCQAIREKTGKGLSPFHWKMPVWRGEVRAKAGTPSGGVMDGIRLWYLKAAMDRESGNPATDLEAISSRIYKEKKKVQCSGELLFSPDLPDTIANQCYPCTLLLYVHEAMGEKRVFPQHSTVGRTVAGSGYAYRAYRDLSWYQAEYLKDLFGEPITGETAGRR